MPRQPMQLAKLKSYDWQGALLALVGFGALAVLFDEGERFDWFDSPTVSVCALVAGLGVPLFIWREATAPAPLIGLKLLARRNLLYPATALILFIVIAVSGSTVPTAFLQQVQGYRPVQSQTVTAVIAVGQLVLLPATAWLLDHRWADARAVGATGLLCIAVSCGLGLTLNSQWNFWQFMPLQVLQAVGQPLVVMPLLMTATNVLSPEEGPLGAALVNAPRALAEALGSGLLSLMTRLRGSLHRSRILDVVGGNRVNLQRTGVLPRVLFQPTVSTHGPHAAALRALDGVVSAQATVLTTIDTYFVLAALALFLLVLQIVIPTRTLPPRLALAGKG